MRRGGDEGGEEGGLDRVWVMLRLRSDEIEGREENEREMTKGGGKREG
jgi:hypothetical protein